MGFSNRDMRQERKAFRAELIKAEILKKLKTLLHSVRYDLSGKSFQVFVTDESLSQTWYVKIVAEEMSKLHGVLIQVHG